MEGNLSTTPNVGSMVDSIEAKYVSGLSTVLVATIQEAKDRISQIEYIFCSQLFPNFQSKSTSLQKIYTEARKHAEDSWKEKEKELLCQIENLHREIEKVADENQLLKLEKTKQSEEPRGQSEKIDDLRRELKQKSKEVDEGMELHSKLISLVQAKDYEILNKDEQIKEQENKINGFVAEVKSMEKRVENLHEELRAKTEKLSGKEEILGNLLKKIEYLSSENMNSERLSNELEMEKKRLSTKLEIFEENISRLQLSLSQKAEEIEKGKKVREQLHHRADKNEAEMLKNKQEREDHEKEKELLMAKVKRLEEKITELQFELKDRSSEFGKGRDAYECLRKENELKSSELVTERLKRNETIEAYKRLKSQYNYLLKKHGLTSENSCSRNDFDQESEASRHQDQITSNVLENRNLGTSANKVKKENINSKEEEKAIKMVQTSGYRSPNFNPVAPREPTSAKPASVAGTKRPASYWRETRSRQLQGGPDPHDDFLDTPLENIREDLNKAMKEGAQDRTATAPKDATMDNSDDETQDMNADARPQKQPIQISGSGKRSFKYVEPVRKKADRENLKGIECKQCKKFYDAVLPNVDGKDGGNSKQSHRCEHEDGVSRHRYKYAPPMTPEGFWNIGFESEM